MKCPRDNSELSPHKKGNIDIQYCESCSGFSVHLEQKSANQLEAQLSRQFSNPQREMIDDELVSPYSGTSMRRFEYRNVLLDYCEESHSIWFDRGEYPKIFASYTKSKKSISPQGKHSEWSAIDLVPDPVDILEISGSIFESVGDFVSDIISGVDPF